MQTDEVIVKKSKIHGQGVFATRDFKKGEVILHWDASKTLTKKQFALIPEKDKMYVSCFGGKYVVMQAPEKYVNHSCCANTIQKKFCDVAKRQIKKGEEITANYEKQLPANTRVKCNCHGQNCLGVFTS